MAWFNARRSKARELLKKKQKYYLIDNERRNCLFKYTGVGGVYTPRV
jgi:hypothetical protein